LYEVKSLLDKEQRVVPCFKDNLPGTILWFCLNILILPYIIRVNLLW
jgi:hypothetical protein